MLNFMLQPQILAAYVILAVIVAIFGRNRQIGFWGFFILSLLLTPIVTGLFMIFCAPKRVRRHA